MPGNYRGRTQGGVDWAAGQQLRRYLREDMVRCGTSTNIRKSRAQTSDMLDTGDVAELAAAVEAAGWDGFAFTEHPAPSARWLASGGHQSIDPLVGPSACGGRDQSNTPADVPGGRSLPQSLAAGQVGGNRRHAFERTAHTRVSGLAT